VDRSWEYINCSQRHECGNWERGRAVSFLGIYKSDLLDAVRFECKQPIKLSGIWKIEDIWLEKEKQRSHLIDICLPLYLLIILWVWGEKILLAKRETLQYFPFQSDYSTVLVEAISSLVQHFCKFSIFSVFSIRR
jgi:hypothetical protein